MAAANEASINGVNYISRPEENDVLLGRGSGVNKFKGNKLFRALIDERKHEYSTTPDKRTKNRISSDILDAIHALGGRFLKPVGAHNAEANVVRNGTWVEVDDDIALEKCKQALRQQHSLRKRNAPLHSTEGRFRAQQGTNRGIFPVLATNYNMPRVPSQFPEELLMLLQLEGNQALPTAVPPSLSLFENASRFSFDGCLSLYQSAFSTNLQPSVGLPVTLHQTNLSSPSSNDLDMAATIVQAGASVLSHPIVPSYSGTPQQPEQWTWYNMYQPAHDAATFTYHSNRSARLPSETTDASIVRGQLQQSLLNVQQHSNGFDGTPHAVRTHGSGARISDLELLISLANGFGS